jgi:hypothetical protein
VRAFHLQNEALREPGNIAAGGNGEQNPGGHSVSPNKALNELIAADLPTGDAHSLRRLGFYILRVGDLTQAHSDQSDPPEAEEFADGEVRVGNASIAIEDRHTIRCVLEGVGENPFV